MPTLNYHINHSSLQVAFSSPTVFFFPLTWRKLLFSLQVLPVFPSQRCLQWPHCQPELFKTLQYLLVCHLVSIKLTVRCWITIPHQFGWDWWNKCRACSSPSLLNKLFLFQGPKALRMTVFSVAFFY